MTDAHTAIQIEALSSFQEAAELRAEWESLLAQAETNTIYQSLEWMECWWRCCAAGRKLCLLIAREQGILVGIAPCCIARRRVNALQEEMLELIGAANYASDYCDFIYPAKRPEILQTMLDWLVSSKERWTCADFFNLPSHSSTRTLLQNAFEQRGLWCRERLLYDCPTCLLEDNSHNQKLVNKKSLKRHVNYFQRSGKLEFRHCRSVEEIQAYLEPFFQQHRDRWQATDTPSLFVHDENRRFYHCLAESLTPHDWLRFAVVLYNGTPIAFHFGFEYNGRFIWYKPSFDPALQKKSPGEVLLKFLLEYAIERGLREFDFTAGGEAFKYRFANTIRSNSQICVYRRRQSVLLADCRSFVGRTKRALSAALQQREEITERVTHSVK